jgi:hypothetical protein
MNCLIFIGIVAFRCEYEKVRKIRVAEESFDTLNDIAIVHIEHFIGNDYLLLLKFQMAWKFMINDLVQFMGILEGETDHFAELEDYSQTNPDNFERCHELTPSIEMSSENAVELGPCNFAHRAISQSSFEANGA